MSIGDFPESLSQAMLVGIIAVGRLGVRAEVPAWDKKGRTNRDQTRRREMAQRTASASACYFASSSARITNNSNNSNNSSNTHSSSNSNLIIIIIIVVLVILSLHFNSNNNSNNSSTADSDAVPHSRSKSGEMQGVGYGESPPCQGRPSNSSTRCSQFSQPLWLLPSPPLT